MTACAAARALEAKYTRAPGLIGKSAAADKLYYHMFFCEECHAMNEIETEWGRATVIGRNEAGDKWLVSIGRNGHSDEEWRELSPLGSPCVFRWIAAPGESGAHGEREDA